MVEDVKGNFKKQYKDLHCPLECKIKHIDSQRNLLLCTALKEVDSQQIKYSHIFSNDIKIQLNATNVFIKLIETRKRLLGSKKPSPCTKD